MGGQDECLGWNDERCVSSISFYNDGRYTNLKRSHSRFIPFFLLGEFSVKGVAEMLAIGLGLDRTTFLEASKTGRVLLNFLKHVT